MRKVEIYIDGKLIPYTQDFFSRMPFTYTLADIQNPKQRNGTGTQIDIDLPASPELNKIFANASYANTVLDTENTVKFMHVTTILVNGYKIFHGSAKVKSSTMLNGKPSTYTVVFVGDFISWYDDLSTIYMKDLGFDNIVFSQSIIEGSWTETAATLDYVFPYIAYGELLHPGPTAIVSIEDMKPCFYFSTILKKALTERLGYKINSTFLSSAYFQRLFLSYFGNWKLSDAYLDSLKFQAQSTSDLTVNNPSFVDFVFPNDSTSGNFDNPGDYDASTSTYTASRTGHYAFRFIFNIEADNDNGLDTNVTVRANYFGTGILGGFRTFTAPSVPAGTFQTADITSPEIYLRAGDSVKFEVTYYNFGTAINPVVTIETGAILQLVPSPDILAGDTIDFASVLDSTIPVSELILDIFRVFNLYCITDEVMKVLTIEPRDTFYYGIENSVNWSAKIDMTKITRDFLLYTYAQRVQLKYASDGLDAYVKEWETINNDSYQSYRDNLQDGFNTGDFVIDTKHLAPTMAYKTFEFARQNITVPQLFQTLVAGGALPSATYGFKPRLLYYHGLDTNIDWYWLDRSSGTSSTNGFPLCYAVNPYQDGTVDSLAWCSYEEQPGLYETRYKNYFEVIKNGYLVSCKVRLTSTDIASLMDDGQQRSLWRKPIYIQALGGYYVLNSIKNFNATTDDLTDVELISYFPLKLPDITHAHKFHFDNNTGGLPRTKEPHPVTQGTGNPPTGPVETWRDKNLPSLTLPGPNGSYAPEGQGIIAFARNTTFYRPFSAGFGNYADVNENTIFAMGNGTDESNRSNAIEVRDISGVPTLYVNGIEVSTDVDLDSRTGIATMTGTTVTVSVSGLTSGSIVMITPITTVALGIVSISSRGAGQFIISSTATETALQVGYFIAKY